MHEMSLCRSIADLVAAAAAESGVAVVGRITLEIGMAAPVEIEAIRFCLPLCLADTCAAEAEIVVERPAMTMRCIDCGTVFVADRRFTPCPGCGGAGGDIVAGREMRVRSIEAA